jgi:mannitol-specific phosphotransferase system IIBC component
MSLTLCGIPYKELGSFKIPKISFKMKDEKKSSKKREEYRTSKTKKDEKEKSHKSETNKDATRNK